MSATQSAKSASSKIGGSMNDMSTASASMAKDPLLVKIYESLKQMRRKQSAAAQPHANGGSGSRSSSVSNLSAPGVSEKSSAQSSSRKVSSSSSAAKAAPDAKSDAASSLTSSGFGSSAQRSATRDESSRSTTERERGTDAASTSSAASAHKPPAASSSTASKQAAAAAAALKPRTRAEMEERKQKLALQAQSMLRDIEQLMRAKKAAAAASNAGASQQHAAAAQARGDAGRAQSEAGRMGPTAGPGRTDQSALREQQLRALQQQPHPPSHQHPSQAQQQQPVVRLQQVRQSPPVRMQAFAMPVQNQQQQQLTPMSIIALDNSGALVNGTLADASRGATGFYAESPHSGAVLMQQQPGGGATIVGHVLPSGHVSLTPNPPRMGRATAADEHSRMSSSSNALGIVDPQQQQVALNYVHLIPMQQQQQSVEYRLRSNYPDLIPMRLGGAASATTLVLGTTPTQGTLYIAGNGTPQAIAVQDGTGSQSVLSISSFHRTGSTQSTIMESAAAARDGDRRGDAIEEREEDEASGSEHNADADGDASGSEYCSTCGERIASQSGSRSGSASNLESVASTARSRAHSSRSRASKSKAHQSRSSSVDTVKQQQRHAHKRRQQHQQPQTQQEQKPEKRQPNQQPARTANQNAPMRPAVSSSQQQQQQPQNRAPATRTGGPPPVSGRKSSTLSTVSSVRRPVQRRNVNIQCNRLPAALFAPPPPVAAEPKRKCPSLHRLVNECDLVPIAVTRATPAGDWGFRVFESVYVDAEELARTANLPWSVNGKRPVLASRASAFSRRPDSAGGTAAAPNAAAAANSSESLIAVDSVVVGGLVAQAALGGLREGDFLVELDGVLVTDVPLLRVQQLLSQSRGTRLALVVARYKPPADTELPDSALKSKSKVLL